MDDSNIKTLLIKKLNFFPSLIHNQKAKICNIKQKIKRKSNEIKGFVLNKQSD